MRFFSDNAAAACPQVMAALAEANRLDTAYDGDAWSQRLDGAFSDLFEREVRALWVTTGTAANCLGLAALCPPHGAILCHERRAYRAGRGRRAGLLHPRRQADAARTARAPRSRPRRSRRPARRVRYDVHQVQPAALSITNATEYGLAYRAAEVAALGEVAKRRRLGFHMDGARFANAVAFTGADPADLTWRAGVDVLSFGFVKNGGMNAEALIFFDPAQAEAVPRLRKRAGHLLSKGRYPRRANAGDARGRCVARQCPRRQCRRARRWPRRRAERLVYPVEANELFVRMTADEAAAIRAQGFDFYDWAPGEVRLVTSWDQDMDAVGAARRGDRGAVNRADRARAHRRVDRHPVHHLHR